MKSGNDLIKKKFDVIDGKIDFMIEFCHTLQSENSELILKIKALEAELDKKNKADRQFSEQEVLIQSKVDGLLKKLNYFSNEGNEEHELNM